MALAHPVKLVLKSTTTQTLSDRFTEMMRNKSPGTQRQRERAREENIAQSRASAKNRRLAEQMSNRRDAVMDQFENNGSTKATKNGGAKNGGANNGGANNGETNNVKSRLDQSRVNNTRNNVRERLGRTNNTNGNVQSRLGNTRGGGVRGRSLSRGRLDTAATPRGNTRAFNGRGTRASPRRGGNSGGFTRGVAQQQQQQQRVGRFAGRARGGRGGGAGSGDRGANRTAFTRGRSRSRGRGGRGGGRGGGRFVDRGDLDNELDSYMSNM